MLFRSVILEDVNVKASVVGNEGSYKLKWVKGKKTEAYFKTGGDIITEGESVRLETFNWYTFFVQDSERRTKIIYVYINQ